MKEWEKKDPIIRFKKYLLNKKLLTEKEDKKIITESKNKVESEVKAAELVGIPPVEDMFNYMFAEKTQALTEQLKQAKKLNTPKKQKGDTELDLLDEK